MRIGRWHRTLVAEISDLILRRNAMEWLCCCNFCSCMLLFWPWWRDVLLVGHCHAIIKELFSFFGQCHPMNIIWVGLYRKQKNFSFQIHWCSVQKHMKNQWWLVYTSSIGTLGKRDATTWEKIFAFHILNMAQKKILFRITKSFNRWGLKKRSGRLNGTTVTAIVSPATKEAKR